MERSTRAAVPRLCASRGRRYDHIVSTTQRVCVAYVLALMCALAALPRSALACARSAVPNLTYAIDPSLQASDREPPSPFTEVSAFAFKIEDTVCKGNRCTMISCPDAGGIELTFADPVDDQTPRDQLGYRIVVLEGALPASMLTQAAMPRPLTQALFFEIGFDEVSRLDAVIALVAIDRAGNESAPSAPIALRDSGCTRSWLDGKCLEDIDAGGAPPDCSVRSAQRRTAYRPIAAIPLLALGLLLRRQIKRTNKAPTNIKF